MKHGTSVAAPPVSVAASPAWAIRVRGLVQGVGFRPGVWHLARALGLRGEVLNDGEGVLIRILADADRARHFIDRLRADCPPLARIDDIQCRPLPAAEGEALAAVPEFAIRASAATAARTGVVPDAATCPACLAEIRDPRDRRHRYPFANCTHCGPRLSILAGIPYDRARTSMAAFPLCPDCAAEYADPADRRFHAQPIACPRCGPRAWLVEMPVRVTEPNPDPMPGTVLDPERTAALATHPEGARRLESDPSAASDPASVDGLTRASRLLADGRILAVKGIGGFHLACDAANPGAVAELRRRKRRFAKPFALMARDLETIRRYCRVSEAEAALLTSPAAPILLLEPKPEHRLRPGDDLPETAAADPAPSGAAPRLESGAKPASAPVAAPGAVAAPALAPGIAPGQTALGFMLPYSPLHHLLLADWDRPLVMTSGNLSEEPQCIDNDEARARLGGLADALLLHDRAILNRLDDSVMRVMAGAPRLLRRARGLAPAPLPLPPGFAAAPPVLAFGGELKNTFCLTRDGQAILSQHLGDLEEAGTAREYARALELYRALFQHRPEWLAADLHPDYRSTLLAREQAAREGLPLILVQHHHAHIASTLADQGWPLAAGPVLGVALDGLGFGADGTLWGGEWLVADYREFRRVAHLKPVAMPGGARAVREPWRNLYAHLDSALGWPEVRARHPRLPAIERLAARPLGVLATMLARGINAPLASSAGRLFDAVAAALGVCEAGVSYEGEAAVALETLATAAGDERGAYPFAVRIGESGLAVLDPAPLWEALLGDLASGQPPARIAWRFHAGFAAAVASLTLRLARAEGLTTVALSGGVFHNRLLLEALAARLEAGGARVLLQRQVPSGDGGIALGQAAVASARALGTRASGPRADGTPAFPGGAGL